MWGARHHRSRQWRELRQLCRLLNPTDILRLQGAIEVERIKLDGDYLSIRQSPSPLPFPFLSCFSCSPCPPTWPSPQMGACHPCAHRLVRGTFQLSIDNKTFMRSGSTKAPSRCSAEERTGSAGILPLSRGARADADDRQFIFGPNTPTYGFCTHIVWREMEMGASVIDSTSCCGNASFRCFNCRPLTRALPPSLPRPRASVVAAGGQLDPRHALRAEACLRFTAVQTAATVAATD